MSPDRPEQSAESAADDATDGDDVTYERFVFWHLGEYRFAVPVADVKAITERPTGVTTVPRSPTAVEGVTDLRGEITAIIDPRAYVPDVGDPAAERALLVLDRPTDEQAAAIVVDDVHGVETVPEDDVFAPDDFDPEDVAGSALDHPLLVGLVRRTWRDEDAVREEIVAQVERRAGDEFSATFDDSDRESGIADATADRSGADATDDGVEVGEFTLDEADALDTDPLDADSLDEFGIDGLGDDDASAFDGADDAEFATGGDAPGAAAGGAGSGDDAGADDVEVDVTPVVSIDRLLRAIEGERDRRQTAR